MAEGKNKPNLSRFNPVYQSKRAYAAMGAEVTMFAIKSADGTRNQVPEPFDLPDHFGNMAPSMAAGYVAGIVASNLFAKSRLAVGDPETVKRNGRLTMAAGGLLVGAVVNTISETKWGLSILPGFEPSNSVVDPLDFTYGVATSTGTAALASKIETAPVATEIPHEPIQTNPNPK